MTRHPGSCAQFEAVLFLTGGLLFLGGCAVIAWAVTR